MPMTTRAGLQVADELAAFIDTEVLPGLDLEPDRFWTGAADLFARFAPENRRLLDEGHALVGLNPEVGHMLMGYEDVPYAYGLVLEYGRLAHTHWNSQPLGNYDQDLNVGVISPEATEAALYAMKMYGYTGWFGIDVNPERMPVDVALRNSMDALRAANDRINNMDHEAIIWVTEHPDKARGWLEAYLIRQRARNPEMLGPMPKLER